MVDRNTEIGGSDYNAIRSKVIEILGTGAGTYGYGQDLQSSAVYTGMTITENQWDLLRWDITNIVIHQDGFIPNIPDADDGQVIGGGLADPANYYVSLLDIARPKRFLVAPGQYSVTSAAIKTTTASWNSSATATITVSFPNATEARYFYNSGGKIRLSSTRTGGTVSAQNNAWTNLLTSIGEQEFGADAQATVNYYNLTSSYQTFYQESSTTPYSANFVKMEALCDVANNNTGTAEVVTIRITWSDSYVDPGAPAPGDLVNGTLSLFVDEIKAAGFLKPNDDAWNITSPAISVSSISTS
jgi:hypothetical protein